MSQPNSPVILNGSKCAAVIQEQLGEIVARLKGTHGLIPGLDVLLIGDSAASISYVTGKKKAAEKIGISGRIHHYPADITLAYGLEKLEEIQNQSDCNGVLVQLPLPDMWSADGVDAERRVIDAIQVAKDVDGFTLASQGHLFSNHPEGLKPCTPMGILALMKAYGLKTEAVRGKNVCVVGRSHIVGNPICHLLSQKPQEDFNLGLGDATVTQCNSRTKDLARHCLDSDIIISATGYPGLVRADMVKPGAVLMDVGVNRVEDSGKKRGYRLVGDIDYEAVLPKAGYITPVPGGIGPMTITMLLYNTIQAACLQNGLAIPGLDWADIQCKIAEI
ncbi:bifunctional 5,10-methylenetetrahydrofolate dehydrogenase/5,10-methenyltetrahydrofolate cyclohydrolase [Candidatus Haliotispira prima]|uniref:Bifunctional protein FolD n=1 Tax=Candidatus Haliotispira prima TaxID=3034016 RepID=A0ABY8MJK8_9SPIO|nr:bifunctional 5,10-methylenetetrahydrofolate dehydrogenase/5,10-methenyltetrahydrofolate cyclohydrolase [Candidatus Haliotispira prima]